MEQRQRHFHFHGICLHTRCGNLLESLDSIHINSWGHGLIKNRFSIQKWLFNFIQISTWYTVQTKSLDTPSHSKSFLYFHDYENCRFTLKASKLWINTCGIIYITKKSVKQLKICHILGFSVYIYIRICQIQYFLIVISCTFRSRDSISGLCMLCRY